ncbi:MAG: GAF domain-containing protein [Bacteroidales bacterium]|nr:GAF domain-containing protein [Bacteroidales bacterium]
MTKEEKYILLVKQCKALLEGESDEVARMANVAALIHSEMGFWWTGFYRVCGEELVLGPFQGPVACTRIAFGRGVCGTAWKDGRTIIVPDVDAFPGHIACSSASRSEIVVPIRRSFTPGTATIPSERPSTPGTSPGIALSDPVVAVLDIDSRELNTFDDIDRVYLEQIAAFLLPSTEFGT